MRRPTRGLYGTVRFSAAFSMIAALLVVLSMPWAGPARAQESTQQMLDEAARRTGLSREELLKRYEAGQGGVTAEPGRSELNGIDDSSVIGRGESSYWVERPDVALPMSEAVITEVAAAVADDLAVDDGPVMFGENFFDLDANLFAPPSFGPVPSDYTLGVGDELIIDMWGDVEQRVTRVVDRDGSIILPRGGKVLCHDRPLDEVAGAIRKRLAASYAGLDDGSIQLDVGLGKLRSIRVFVIGDVKRPGAYELSSVSTVMTALHAAGGPSGNGSFRAVRLMRGGELVTSLDLYSYLIGGVREQDRVLREGDTVLVPPRGRTVVLAGAVRRGARFELTPNETLEDLLRYGGGFTPVAEQDIVHVERIIPAAERKRDESDRTWLDLYLDPATGRLLEPASGVLLDGDRVVVDTIPDKLWGWVEIKGHVKRPGRYQFNEGLTVSELIAQAGGPWPDVLLQVAVIDRVDDRQQWSTIPLPLGRILQGDAVDAKLQQRDVLHVFAEGELVDRDEVTISGEVRKPGSYTYRQGMTLLDLLVRANGLPATADVSHVEVHRLNERRVFSVDAVMPVDRAIDVIVVDLSPDYLSQETFELQPKDHIVVRRLPWYREHRLVAVKGEVFYNGDFSLESDDVRLSDIIERAGGLKPTAFPAGARILREGLGNIAVDLVAAMAERGGPQDVLLQRGDQILVPPQQYTVKVVGEVGFPTALVYDEGRNIDWYVGHAGGYLEKADKSRARVIHPNGLSMPNNGKHRVLPGSVIVVPVQPPPEGPTTLETLKEITAIVAAVATTWLVVDKALE